jgi:LEA14-like dessication related protein
MKVPRLALLLLVLLSLSSCRLIFQQPEIVKIQDLMVDSITIDNSTLQLSIIVRNPNSYQIRLKQLEVGMLTPTRQKVGEARLRKELDLPAKKSIQLDFFVDIQTRPMLRMVSSINKELQFLISVKGEGKALMLTKSFDFEQPYSIALEEYVQQLLPKLNSMGGGPAEGQELFKLLRTYVGDYGLSKTALMADFILVNPYGISFKLKGFPSQIYVGGKAVGTGDIAKELVFDENVFYREGSMLYQMSNFKSAFGAVKGAFKGGIDYQVKGEIIIETMGMRLKVPYAYSGVIPVSIWELLLK